MSQEIERKDTPLPSPPVEDMSVKEEEKLPSILQDIYSLVYPQIRDLLHGKNIFDIKKDPSSIRVLIGKVMQIVQRHDSGYPGEKWTGPEKKTYGLMVIKQVLTDLGENEIIDKEVVDEIVIQLDFWGGMIMDLVVDAAKKVIDLGKREVKEFKRDLKESGWKKACGDFWTCKSRSRKGESQV